ncbi:sodium ion-translocating decarboxylase subunit beta [Collinsella tanakaei]|uniref:sodium ion-translocating decarboxylase subunit beta n=1 Tax=Collinsella tanakaei TaxID=626935 RepID=UPI0025A3CA73|nr:sodium ion-translocating decarboxylase subunit beta [Collinsella tanakaei]MDM8299407.1 sodium ion-translocating decarboxylase subunit beta [Collinsella tanakaei]
MEVLNQAADVLTAGVLGLGAEPGRIVMMLVGIVLMYLGIKKEYEPTLLVPMGLGTILVNIPDSGVLLTGGEPGPFQILFDMGIDTELFPLLLFIGIGAMIDFGPLLANPFLLLFGAAAQFGIFFVIIVAGLLGFNLADSASAGIIAAADGPTSIFVANSLQSKYLGAIMVAAYSYMALVPIIQPIAIKAVTTKKERMIRMVYKPGSVSQTAKIIFPIVICIVAGLIAPASLPLVGFLMFGNLLRECGVLDNLSMSAQNELVNLISILLGLCVSVRMQAGEFLQVDTLIIMGLGLLGFVMDTVGGIMFAKVLNIFRKEKINPMIGASGISAFPMSSRVIQRLATEEDPGNFILMQAAGSNVAGQIASVVAGGLILGIVPGML